MRCWSWRRWGRRVLHNRSVELARKYNVKMEVLSSFTGHPGTKVKGVAKRMERSYISSVARIRILRGLPLLACQMRSEPHLRCSLCWQEIM